MPSLDVLKQKLSLAPQDYDAHFDIAVNFVTLYQYEDAINHLFLIIENDMDYKEGAAKELFITITNMPTPVNNDLAQQFRRKLSNLLSS